MIELPFELPDFGGLDGQPDLDVEPADVFEPSLILTGSSPVDGALELPAVLADWLSLDGADDEAELNGLSRIATSDESAATELSRRLAADSSAAQVIRTQGQSLPWL